MNAELICMLASVCEFIVVLPIACWHAWVIHLLKLLQWRLDSRPETTEEYRQMLEQLRDAIDDRLQRGRW